jgi:hypothetical protein
MVELLALTFYKVWGLGPPRTPDFDRERPLNGGIERSTPKAVPIRVWRWLGVGRWAVTIPVRFALHGPSKRLCQVSKTPEL